MASRNARNIKVEETVALVLQALDEAIAGGQVELVEGWRTVDSALRKGSASVRTATLFLLFYRIVDGGWDGATIPVGIRGAYGDKLLCEELAQRSITLHGQITAFGENLGWKGNVRGYGLASDPRFADVSPLLTSPATTESRRALAIYAATMFATSRVVIEPLPPVGTDVLTFVRARRLFDSLLVLESEGHIQQFVMAALLSVYRARVGTLIGTHHPHASDRSDGTAGDIEEFRDDELVRAYEVTVRPDWKNRLSNFKSKMDRFGLTKYVIFASDVRESPDLREGAKTALDLERLGRDVAVVDLQDVTNFLAADLSAGELRQAVNAAYDLLLNPKLSGRTDLAERYRTAVQDWLDDR